MSVRYRWDISQPWATVQGETWETQQVPPSCVGPNIRPTVKVSAVVGGYSNGSLVLTPVSGYINVPGVLGTVFDKLEVFGIYFVVSFRYPSGQIATNGIYHDSSYGGVGSSNHWHSVDYVTTEFYYYNSSSTTNRWVLINPATFQNTALNSCSPESCNLKVYSGQQVTLDITNPTCPQVELFEGCPPDTCEVDCGAYVCCYNSQGISTFNYNK